MKRFEKKTLSKDDHKNIERLAALMRFLLTPIFVWYRIYLWVWDGSMFNE